jgi:hypothetical protein
MSAIDECTAISSPNCTIEETIYGYYPNLGVNAFFVAFFAIGAISHIVLGIKWKTYFFGGAMTLGSIGEALGYVGRIMLHRNPVSRFTCFPDTSLAHEPTGRYNYPSSLL